MKLIPIIGLICIIVPSHAFIPPVPTHSWSTLSSQPTMHPKSKVMSTTTSTITTQIDVNEEVELSSSSKLPTLSEIRRNLDPNIFKGELACIHMDIIHGYMNIHHGYDRERRGGTLCTRGSTNDKEDRQVKGPSTRAFISPISLNIHITHAHLTLPHPSLHLLIPPLLPNRSPPNNPNNGPPLPPYPNHVLPRPSPPPSTNNPNTLTASIGILLLVHVVHRSRCRSRYSLQG